MKKDMIRVNCQKCGVQKTIHKSWKDGPILCVKCEIGKDGLDRFRLLPSLLRKEGCLSCGFKRLKIKVDKVSFYVTSRCSRCYRVRRYGINAHELRTRVTPFLEEVDI